MPLGSKRHHQVRGTVWKSSLVRRRRFKRSRSRREEKWRRAALFLPRKKIQLSIGAHKSALSSRKEATSSSSLLSLSLLLRTNQSKARQKKIQRHTLSDAYLLPTLLLRLWTGWLSHSTGTKKEKGKKVGKEEEEVTVRATKNLLARQTPRCLLINTKKYYFCS